MQTVILHQDKNISPAEFRATGTAGQLHVTRIFRTIQGEGPHSGRPAVFLRLSGCNLGAKKDCPWCDTEFALRNGQRFAVEAVRDHIDFRRASHIGLVVVTGGEPLLQWDGMQQLIHLMDMPDNRGLTFQFETNGLYLSRQIVEHAREGFSYCQVEFVVSPKIPSVHHRYNMLPEWWFEAPAKWSIDLKFVVSADDDDDYNELPEQIMHRAAHGEPLCDVYVSGMTVYDGLESTYRENRAAGAPTLWRLSDAARAATEANYRHAAQLALAYGFRLSYQTHLLSGLE